MFTKRDLLRSAAIAAITATTVKSVPVSAQTKPEWPNLFEAKTIAEEGFIYGLPIVMNYAVMYEYSVDKNSGQYKAPFNQIKNEARVFTYRTPLSSRPIATRLIRCYGSICALNRLFFRCPLWRRLATIP
jgi:hypothetical protein